MRLALSPYIRFAAISMLSLTFLLPRSVLAVDLAPGQTAPNFTLNDLDGKPVTLEQFRGKVVILAFWSTWCSRCEEELIFLRDNFGDRTDVAVVLINQDSERNVSAKRVRDLLEKLGIRFPVLLDEGLTLWDQYGINALPTALVVGKDGRITHVEPNFYWGSPENLFSAIRRG